MATVPAVAPNMSEKYTDFLVDGKKAVSLTFVSDVAEMATAQRHHPEFVYQHFGENETIFGYKDLEIIVHYTDVSMYIYPEINYSADISSFTSEFKAEDIMEKLCKQLPAERTNMLCRTLAIFRSHLDEQKDFWPFGRLLCKFASGGREMQIWKVTESSPAFDAYLARVETLALWYIEGAQYTDNDDARWMHYFVYESLKKADGSSRLALAGYASLVRFYHYPDKIRPRVAQFLLLPQYRGAGNGARFLQAIYNDLIQDPKVHDITAEDPAESYIRTRDYVDCCNCFGLKEFHADNLKKGFTKEMKDVALERFKIHPRQARRVYEILRLYHTNVRDEKGLKDYRIDVKRRLEKPFKRSQRDWRKLCSALEENEYAAVVANHMGQEQKIAILQQLYEEEIVGYRKVIKLLSDFFTG